MKIIAKRQLLIRVKMDHIYLNISTLYWFNYSASKFS